MSDKRTIALTDTPTAWTPDGNDRSVNLFSLGYVRASWSPRGDDVVFELGLYDQKNIALDGQSPLYLSGIGSAVVTPSRLNDLGPAINDLTRDRVLRSQTGGTFAPLEFTVAASGYLQIFYGLAATGWTYPYWKLTHIESGYTRTIATLAGYNGLTFYLPIVPGRWTLELLGSPAGAITNATVVVTTQRPALLVAPVTGSGGYLVTAFHICNVTEYRVATKFSNMAACDLVIEELSATTGSHFTCKNATVNMPNVYGEYAGTPEGQIARLTWKLSLAAFGNLAIGVTPA